MMMAAMGALLLLDLGVAASKVNTEAFVSPAGSTSPSLDATAPPEAPVIPTSHGRIRFERSGNVTELSSAKTILETAEDAGVSIPFECRSGICGQCKTRLVSGRVTMESEDALSAAGESARKVLILACQ